MTLRGRRYAVLIVEDEPLLRLDIAQAFGAAGFTVYQAATVGGALETLALGYDLDLVFTDIDMPGSLDGLDLTRIVKTRWPDLPVLVTSGGPRPEIESGARFVPKPYDAGKIVTKARALAA